MSCVTRHIRISHIFFYLFGVHRDLHSFPTRRSSDLLLKKLAGSTNAKWVTVRGTSGLWLSGAPHVFTHLRSEEHTSELQSHSDLVCRLLLEKKKIWE